MQRHTHNLIPQRASGPVRPEYVKDATHHYFDKKEFISQVITGRPNEAQSPIDGDSL
jgi:hypothetical protein